MNYEKSFEKKNKINRQADINNLVYEYISGEILDFSIAAQPK